jgi:hypothetical protein
VDHLPYPDHPTCEAIEVPFIFNGLIFCKRTSFASFRTAFPTGPEHWHNMDPDVAAKAAQAFIYFGLLQDIIGRTFCINDFIGYSDTSYGHVISLSNLCRELNTAYRLHSHTFTQDEDYFIDLMSSSLEYISYIPSTSQWVDTVRVSIEILVWSLEKILCPSHPPVYCRGGY